jgi:hypothetical protein
VFSQRALERPVWHAAQYEFEDLPLGLDDVDLLAPPRQPHPGASRESRRVVNGLLKRAGVPRRTPPWNRPSMRPTRVEADHDLFFAVLYSGYQIAHLHRLRGWRERSRHTACLLVEMWGRNVGINEDYLRLLADFDVVYVMNPAILPRLAQLGVTRTTFMPVGVDTVAFSPLPHLPPRSIDLLGYGRTSPVVHREALELVSRRGLAYVYDSLQSIIMRDHREHRALTANLLKRARFFFASKITDSPERQRHSGGQEALSGRYFEGAASGAVMLGSLRDTPEAAACFDWPDVVLPLSYERPELADVCWRTWTGSPTGSLSRDRTRSASLRRHDWLHRWRTVLDDAGLAPTSAMRARAAALEELAEASTPDLLHGGRQPQVGGCAAR